MIFTKETVSSKASSLASRVETTERTGPGLGVEGGAWQISEELGLGIKGSRQRCFLLACFYSLFEQKSDTI